MRFDKKIDIINFKFRFDFATPINILLLTELLSRPVPQQTDNGLAPVPTGCELVVAEMQFERWARVTPKILFPLALLEAARHVSEKNAVECYTFLTDSF